MSRDVSYSCVPKLRSWFQKIVSKHENKESQRAVLDDAYIPKKIKSDSTSKGSDRVDGHRTVNVISSQADVTNFGNTIRLESSWNLQRRGNQIHGTTRHHCGIWLTLSSYSVFLVSGANPRRVMAQGEANTANHVNTPPHQPTPPSSPHTMLSSPSSCVQLPRDVSPLSSMYSPG